jgi:hypothetical protein
MNCSEVIDTQTYAIHTDVSRPSPPLNTKIILVGQRLQLQWTPPSSPRGPIDEYRFILYNEQRLCTGYHSKNECKCL